MYRYLYVNPRGFRNEFSVYRVPPHLIKEAEDLVDRLSGDPNAEAYWITRKEAERIVAAEKRLAREYIKAGLNLHQNPVGATEIVDFVAYPD